MPKRVTSRVRADRKRIKKARKISELEAERIARTPAERKANRQARKGE
jgi:hypothetical protein